MTVKFLTGYGQRPQHLLGMVGLAAFGFGTVGMLVLTAAWFLSRIVAGWPDIHLHERAIFFYSLCSLLLGAQFLSVGFLAELIAARENAQGATYSIAESTQNDGTKSAAPRSELVKPPYARHPPTSTRRPESGHGGQD